ncbi:MAG: hypothetical protein AAF927_03075 [Bacteroidota bacterium]
MRRLNVLLILALLIFGRLEIVSAQQARHAPWLDLWFLQARFSESDKNKDQQLSYSEMEAFPEEWAYFLIDEFFSEADLNQDGFLNEAETWRRLGSAHQYRVKLDASLVSDLREKYPFFDDAKLVYFKRHPKLTAELFKNLSWLRIHPDIPYKLLSNASWWAENPEVTQALHANLTGLAEHPSIALRFYALPSLNRYVGPDRSFKAGYKNLFIERKREQSYAFRISFYDEDIPTQQLQGAPVAEADADGQTKLKPRLPAEASDLQAEADQLEAELLSLIERLRKENEVLKSAEASLQEQIEALNQALSEAAKRPDKNTLLMLQRKVAELTSAKSQLESELNQAVFAQRETKVDGSKQLAEIDALKGQIITLEEENNRLQRLMRSNSSDLREANVAQENQIRQLQGVIAQMGSQLDQVKATDNSAEIQRYQNRIRSLQASLETSQQDLEHVKKSWNQTANQLTEVNQERRQLKLALQNLEAQQMVKREQLDQSLENQKLDQDKYETLLAENQQQKLEIQRLNGSIANLEQSLLSKANVDDRQIRKEVEAQYIASFQKQMNRNDSITRLNRELSQQVDALQMQFVQMEMSQANVSANTEASLERLEQHYQKQTQNLKAEIAALRQQNQQLSQQARAVPVADPNLAAEKDALASENQQVKMEMARMAESLQSAQEVEQQFQSNITSLEQQLQTLTAERDAALAQAQNLSNAAANNDAEEVLNQLNQENTQLKQELANQKMAANNLQNALNVAQNESQSLSSLQLAHDSLIAKNDRLIRMNRLQEEQITSMKSQLKGDEQKRETIAEERENEYRNRIIKLEGQIAEQNKQRLAIEEELESLKVRDADLSSNQQAQLLEIKRLQLVQDSLMKENFALSNQNEAQSKQLALSSQKEDEAQNALKTKMVGQQQEAAARINKLESSLNDTENLVLQLNSQVENQKAEIDEFTQNQAILLKENDRLTLAIETQENTMKELEEQKARLESQLSIAKAASAELQNSAQAEVSRIDTIEKQLLVLEMEKQLGREVEDSLMARSQRQLAAIRRMKQERDTLIKSIRDRDRVIESYATRMQLQKDSLAQLLTMQNKAFSAISSEKSNGLERIDKLHQQIQSLEYDNEKLRERVDETLRNEDKLKLQLAKIEAHNLALEEKNKALQAKKRRKNDVDISTASLAVQLESLQSEKRDLAIEKASLQEQLLALETFIGQIRQSESRLKREVQVQKALNTQLDHQVDSLEQAIEKFHSYNWPDSVDYYRNQLLYARASTENQRGMAIASDLNHERQKDSLMQEIMRIEESFAQRESNNKVNQQRIRAIETQERELERDRQALAKQEQLIRQQSRMIEDRLKALSDLEERYLDVLEREKELQMIEQNLKQQPGYKEAKREFRRSGEE